MGGVGGWGVGGGASREDEKSGVSGGAVGGVRGGGSRRHGCMGATVIWPIGCTDATAI